MSSIHLIEKIGLVRHPKGKEMTQDWESPAWAISEETAKSLIGGHVYFHKRQSDRSFFGGVITGYHYFENLPASGRIVIEFTFDPICKNVNTSRTGWSMEKKIVE